MRQTMKLSFTLCMFTFIDFLLKNELLGNFPIAFQVAHTFFLFHERNIEWWLPDSIWGFQTYSFL